MLLWAQSNGNFTFTDYFQFNPRICVYCVYQSQISCCAYQISKRHFVSAGSFTVSFLIIYQSPRKQTVTTHSSFVVFIQPRVCLPSTYMIYASMCSIITPFNISVLLTRVIVIMMTPSNGKHFPRYRPIVRRIHRSPVNFPHKGQRCGALIFSLICAWINAIAFIMTSL